MTDGCITETIPTSFIISDSINYSFEVEMTMTSSLNDRNFVFKYKDHANWYGIHTYGNNVWVQKVVNGIEYKDFPGWHSNFDFIQDETYKFKIELINNYIYTYINHVGSLTQPELVSTVVDTAPMFTNFSAGLQASGYSITWFDNVKVEEILPLPLPQPTIGPFELPFNYSGRPATNQSVFKEKFHQYIKF